MSMSKLATSESTTVSLSLEENGKEKQDQDHPLKTYLNVNRFIFCPGCLIGTMITSVAASVKEEGLGTRDVALVSGIGCTGRSSGCFKAPAFHTTHGRAIPFATGLKLANPNLKVFVLSGDGDLSAIGGNHLIHAARRNMDIVVICINNSVYGMTGGQVAPTTPEEAFTATTPYGNPEPPFNLVSLAASSGATYVARWPGYDTLRLRKSIKKAIQRTGFSFIEIIAPCFTQYGKFNKLGGAVQMLKMLEPMIIYQNGCPPQDAVFDLNEGKIVCGEFVNIERESFLERLQVINEKAKKGAK